ncbi:ATP-binding cassette domain-containing protein [Clostridium sp. MSJ-4]|uniref:ATP-binding cassette domain-containing protein n=1 Tax=Clostridium simiarum TaxID=2841506 RepID=A0ABS6F4G8_9CLOT|nr:ATP-binding cassette domain-containing protein [Clostridium simiarum]MBU5592749.1 ATP-binding cassette domain-containing protein [Clostridium simiarum]
MSLLAMNGVTYEDKGNTIINNFNLEVEKEDYISIVGPSGSGKSTILKLFASLISPSKGDIYFKGEDYINSSPYDLRKNITYCFQTPVLFGNTVIDNFKFPYDVRKKDMDTYRINYLLNLFGFSESMLHKSIHKLSGGEKQRIALIRSIIFEPEVLLLDEVTSALDAENTKIVESVIQKLNLEGMTILWVTHNLEQSRKYANKLLTVEKGTLKDLEVIK